MPGKLPQFRLTYVAQERLCLWPRRIYLGVDFLRLYSHGNGRIFDRLKNLTGYYFAIFVGIPSGTQREHRGKTSTHAPGWTFPVTFSSQSLPRCSVCSLWFVVLLHAARVFDYFVVIDWITFMRITRHRSLTQLVDSLDSEKVRW